MLYDIQCRVIDTSATQYNNSHLLGGYLYSRGANTGVLIDNLHDASSYASSTPGPNPDPTPPPDPEPEPTPPPDPEPEPTPPPDPIPTPVPGKYRVILHSGSGINSVSGAGNYEAGETVHINASVKEGYHWGRWTGTYSTGSKSYSFTMPEHDVSMTANAEANSYTIHFDPNGGTGHIDDIQTTYDTDVTLPDATDIYKKYTLDGVNVTDDVVSGLIPEDLIVRTGAPEEETEAAEIIKAAHSLKKAYKSVFLGWAFYEDKDNLTPTWKAGDVVRNLTAENNGVVTLYAVWDDCPWITAKDLYYTLEQAQSGYITEAEILSHASATHREDGSPILPGTNPAVNNPAVNTIFNIPDYQEYEFTDLTHDAVISENLTVVDSVGNTYQKQIMVYVVDTTPVKVKPRGVTRFISEKYFNAPYESGGLEDNSIWKNNSEYRAALQSAFDHFKNDTSEQIYTFTQEQILEVKEYVQENGIGNSKSPDALQKFYEQFMR